MRQVKRKIRGGMGSKRWTRPRRICCHLPLRSNRERFPLQYLSRRDPTFIDLLRLLANLTSPLPLHQASIACSPAFPPRLLLPSARSPTRPALAPSPSSLKERPRATSSLRGGRLALGQSRASGWDALSLTFVHFSWDPVFQPDGFETT